jgi:hypothetical protein
MAKIKAAPISRLNAAMRKAFLSHLSETANVSASARAIDVGTSSIYAERRRSVVFRADWSVALAEGYARLEADMLLDALTSPSAKTTDAMLKARAQKDRLRLALLSMHRTSVKTAAAATPALAIQEAVPTKANLITRLFKMRANDDSQTVVSGNVPEGNHG